MSATENQFMANLYYKFCDSKQFPEMFALFSDTIEYQRNDQLIKGKQAFQNYYLNERKMEGKHTIIQTYVIGEDTIISEGTFTGTNAGKPVRMRFSDFMFFKNGKIERKHAYITNGQ